MDKLFRYFAVFALACAFFGIYFPAFMYPDMTNTELLFEFWPLYIDCSLVALGSGYVYKKSCAFIVERKKQESLEKLIKDWLDDNLFPWESYHIKDGLLEIEVRFNGKPYRQSYCIDLILTYSNYEQKLTKNLRYMRSTFKTKQA